MAVTEKNFDKIQKMYQKLICLFFAINGIKEVVCTDIKEHFFDCIVVKENGKITVFKHQLTNTYWIKLYFDFTIDYANCIANMEKKLLLQHRNEISNKYKFIIQT